MTGFIKTFVILCVAFGLCLANFESVSAQTAKKTKSRQTTVAKKKTVKKKTIPPSVVTNPELKKIEPSGLEVMDERESRKGDGRGEGSGTGYGGIGERSTISNPLSDISHA